MKMLPKPAFVDGFGGADVVTDPVTDPDTDAVADAVADVRDDSAGGRDGIGGRFDGFDVVVVFCCQLFVE